MKDTRRELTDEQLNKELGRYAFAVGVSLNQARHIARAVITADRALNAQAEPARRPLFAELIASHEGLAEELKAMDAAPPAEQQKPVAQVVDVDPPGPDGYGVNWLKGNRTKPGDLLYTHQSLSLAELRAEVEGMPYYRGRAWTVKRDDVLALIDKMGGKV